MGILLLYLNARRKPGPLIGKNLLRILSEVIEWTADPGAAPQGDVGVVLRGLAAPLPKEFLDVPQVGAVLREMRNERMQYDDGQVGAALLNAVCALPPVCALPDRAVGRSPLRRR